jgi:hypothetical protein
VVDSGQATRHPPAGVGGGGGRHERPSGKMKLRKKMKL